MFVYILAMFWRLLHYRDSVFAQMILNALEDWGREKSREVFLKLGVKRKLRKDSSCLCFLAGLSASSQQMLSSGEPCKVFRETNQQPFNLHFPLVSSLNTWWEYPKKGC